MQDTRTKRRLGIGALVLAGTTGGVPAETSGGAQAEPRSYVGLTLAAPAIELQGSSDDGLSTFALEYGRKPRGWPAHFVIAASVTDNEDAWSLPQDRDQLTALEVSTGLRRYFSDGSARLFVGGGISVLGVEFVRDDDADTDEDVGAWFEGGVRLRTPYGDISLSLRDLQADVELHGERIEGTTSLQVSWGAAW